MTAKQASKFNANVRRHRRSWHEEVVSPGHRLHDVTLDLQYSFDEVDEKGENKLRKVARVPIGK